MHPSPAPIDFAILTALQVEREAVCHAFGLTDNDRDKREGRWYWRGRLPLPSGGAYEIVVAQAIQMGQAEATTLATNVADEWKPAAALLVGIAASTNPEKVKLGDVIVGDRVYYYEHGKRTDDGTLPQPEMIQADAELIKHYSGLAAWDGIVHVHRPQDGASKVYSGVIASGDKVIASAAVRKEIAAGHRKILALEMEGYGFSHAMWIRSAHIRHLVIRGISDDASKRKNDDWHSYAAATAAGFAKHFLLDRPIEPTSAGNERLPQIPGKPSNAAAASLQALGNTVNLAPGAQVAGHVVAGNMVVLNEFDPTELIGLLESRATDAEHYFRQYSGPTRKVKDIAQRFRGLHAEHIAALRQKKLVAAHETHKKICALESELRKVVSHDNEGTDPPSLSYVTGSFDDDMDAEMARDALRDLIIEAIVERPAAGKKDELDRNPEAYYAWLSARLRAKAKGKPRK